MDQPDRDRGHRPLAFDKVRLIAYLISSVAKSSFICTRQHWKALITQIYSLRLCLLNVPLLRTCHTSHGEMNGAQKLFVHTIPSALSISKNVPNKRRRSGQSCLMRGGGKAAHCPAHPHLKRRRRLTSCVLF